MKLSNSRIFFATSSFSSIKIISKFGRSNNFTNTRQTPHNVSKDFDNSSSCNNWITYSYTTYNDQITINTSNKNVLPNFNLDCIIDAPSYINSNDDFGKISQFIDYICGKQ